MPPLARLLTTVLLGAWAGLSAVRARCDEPDPAPVPAPAPTLRVASAEELPPLLESLEAASKKKKASEALPLLQCLAELTHPDLEKPLHKLLKHAEIALALKAAELLEERTTPESVKALWSASWGQAVNEKRPTVRAKVLRALGRAGAKLDKRQLDDVLDLWRQIQGSATRTQAPMLVDIAFFAEKAKEKRLARPLGEALDEPIAANPNDPANPPASWWEEKWHLWNESKAAVHAALGAITGTELDSTEKAKAWIEAHRREGFDW